MKIAIATADAGGAAGGSRGLTELARYLVASALALGVDTGL
jgi:hypothetical protein